MIKAKFELAKEVVLLTKNYLLANSIKDNLLQIAATNEPISVNIFDIQGRKLAHFSLQVGENKTETYFIVEVKPV